MVHTGFTDTGGLWPGAERVKGVQSKETSERKLPGPAELRVVSHIKATYIFLSFK